MSAPIHSDAQQIQQLLAAWAASEQRVPLVDVRPLQQFLQQRIRGAAHIPPEDFASHCFLLPDKDEPFALLLPSSDDVPVRDCPDLLTFLHTGGWTHVTWAVRECEALWHTAQSLGIWEGSVLDTSHTLTHTHTCDTDAAMQPDQLTQADVLQRFAFKPCPLLAQEIDRLERMLLIQALQQQQQQQQQQQESHSQSQPCAAQHMQHGQSDIQPPMQAPMSLSTVCESSVQGPAQQHSAAVRPLPQQQQQHGSDSQSQPCASQHAQHSATHKPMPRVYTFSCLEPGCGSGRNIAWLIARRSAYSMSEQQQQHMQTEPVQGHAACDAAHSVSQDNTASQQEDTQTEHVRWSAVGLDNWYASLVRVQQLCQYTHIPPHTAPLWYGAIDSDTGTLTQLKLPNSAAGSEPNTHITCPKNGALDNTQGQWHLILCVRFLERAFLRHIPSLLAPGGFVVYNTFLDMEGTRAFGRPKGVAHLLKPGELSGLFGPEQGFDVLRDDVERCRQGRELCCFVARKRSV